MYSLPASTSINRMFSSEPVSLLVAKKGAVMARQYLGVEELPARPDPETGLPRPPRAPWFIGSDRPYREDSNRERAPARAPSPPPGQGPVLAWYRQSRSGALIGAVMFGGLIGALLAITRNIDWVKLWGVWVVLILGMALMYSILRGDRFSAGAEWMASKGRWVRTYELVEVTAHTSGTGVYVTLKDSGGREVEYKFTDLGGSDRLLFDLTYNGILHSVIAGGAQTNQLLHRTLKLPYPESARSADGKHLDLDE